MEIDSLFSGEWNFLGLDAKASSRQTARAWLLPVPYEGTTSYGAGTRDGPSAILAASRQVELYDREFGCECAGEYGIYTTAPLEPVAASPEAMVAAVERAVRAFLEGSPAPQVLGIIGGEHSISSGTARALAHMVPDGSLVAVQIDAHADLRDSYEGSPYSHASAARRILESCPLFQVGIRNISAGEEPFRRGCARLRTIFAEEANAAEAAFLDELARFVCGKNVFLTVDLDGLDPSIMPAVGTPEPGGLSWQRILEVVRTITANAAAVPAFDVVELAPVPGLRAPDFLAALLVYKIFSHVLLKESLPK